MRLQWFFNRYFYQIKKAIFGLEAHSGLAHLFAKQGRAFIAGVGSTPTLSAGGEYETPRAFVMLFVLCNYWKHRGLVTVVIYIITCFVIYGYVAQSVEATDLKSVKCGFESHRTYL